MSRNAIAEIDDGYVTANLAGTGYISASANGETATCKLIIEKPVLKKKTLNMTTNSKAKLKLSNTKLKYAEWKSMNEDVAYVDPVSGTVYSIGTGTTTVTTEAGGVTSSCRIVVKEKGSGKAANK